MSAPPRLSSKFKTASLETWVMCHTNGLALARMSRYRLFCRERSLRVFEADRGERPIAAQARYLCYFPGLTSRRKTSTFIRRANHLSLSRSFGRLVCSIRELRFVG